MAKRLHDPAADASFSTHASAAESAWGEQKFRDLLEAAPDAMVIVDQSGKIVLVNAQAERLFGYGRKEMLGRCVDMLVPLRFREQYPQLRTVYFSQLKFRGMDVGMQLFGLRKDGAEFPVEISLSPLQTQDGVLVSSAIRDITDQKMLEEQLRKKNEELEEQNRRVQEASRLKSEFLANMSHELRTPLNGLIGFSELMYDGRVNPASPEHKEYLGDILTSARHLLRLINDILDMAKVDSGKMEFHPEPVEIGKLISEACDILRTMAARKRIRIRTEIDPAVQGVTLDAAKLKQVLYNYISNALKFTPEDGHVHIRVRPFNEQFFRLEVADDGIGIKQEDIPRLFVEFQQLDGSSTKQYPGTGLGLALTKRLVDAQGGHVGVDSVAGAGSIFFAILPREHVLPSAERPILAAAISKQASRPAA